MATSLNHVTWLITVKWQVTFAWRHAVERLVMLRQNCATLSKPKMNQVSVWSRLVGTRTAWYQTEWTHSNSWYSSQVLSFNQDLIAAGWVLVAFHSPYQPSPSFASSQDNHESWWHALCKGFMTTERSTLLFWTERNRHPHFTSVTAIKELNCTYCRTWSLNGTERLLLSKLYTGLKL